MSVIHIRGPWPWIWAAWGAVRTALVFWGAFYAYWHGFTEEVHLALLGCYTVFIGLELVGAWRLGFNPPGVEIVKTWSQLNQWLARQGRWTAWVAVMNAALDSATVITILSPFSPWVAVLMGGLLGWRLMPHFRDRSDVG